MTQPTLTEFISVFARIGLLSFGGPAAQIAFMHKELVEDRPWLSETQYLSALSFCMLLPGPEAMQLATYAGWKLGGTLGGLIAGLLFVLPGAVVILALASAYAAVGSVPWVAAAFLGVKATVIVIVLQALLKVSAKALTSPRAHGIATLSFLAIFALQVPFPIIILAAALVGAASAGPGVTENAPSVDISLAQTIRTIGIWTAIWLLPLATLWAYAPQILADVAIFFSTLALVTFGGAYAVLAYMIQEVVGTFGWLTTDQMIDALGLAETTPGPLILVTQFVGFLAGEQAGGWGMGLLAALVALWVTFVPCFLWIFTGAPYVDWIATQPRLAGALQGIMAAVVGVIANLSLWFTLNVWFETVERGAFGFWLPDLATVFWPSIVLSLIAVALLLWRKMDLVLVLMLMGLAGIATQMI